MDSTLAITQQGTQITSVVLILMAHNIDVQATQDTSSSKLQELSKERDAASQERDSLVQERDQIAEKRDGLVQEVSALTTRISSLESDLKAASQPKQEAKSMPAEAQASPKVSFAISCVISSSAKVVQDYETCRVSAPNEGLLDWRLGPRQC